MRKVKEPKEKKPNEVAELARWYVEEFENRQFDYRLDKKYLAQAKMLLNPDPDPETGVVPQRFELQDIKDCMNALRDGTHPGLGRIKPNHITFYTLSWGEPPFIVSWATVPPIPPVYEQLAYNDWVMRYGRKAIKQGVWDGLYKGWQGGEGLSFEVVEDIVGWEKANEALLETYSQTSKVS